MIIQEMYISLSLTVHSSQGLVSLDKVVLRESWTLKAVVKNVRICSCRREGIERGRRDHSARWNNSDRIRMMMMMRRRKKKEGRE